MESIKESEQTFVNSKHLLLACQRKDVTQSQGRRRTVHKGNLWGSQSASQRLGCSILLATADFADLAY